MSQNTEKSSKEDRVQLRVQASISILKTENPSNRRATEGSEMFLSLLLTEVTEGEKGGQDWKKKGIGLR